MRLIDVIFRQGHLSERALIGAILGGQRPAHLDRCDICGERAVLLSRWMDELQADATQLTDEIFTPERLAAQQSQILRRLEQIDHPARVISFPASGRLEPQNMRGRRVAVSWVGIAAAAGLILGVVGGQITARLGTRTPVVPVSTSASDTTSSSAVDAPGSPVDSSLLAEPFETLDVRELGALNDMVPRLQAAARSGG